jgi:hypothetical protein
VYELLVLAWNWVKVPSPLLSALSYSSVFLVSSDAKLSNKFSL